MNQPFPIVQYGDIIHAQHIIKDRLIHTPLIKSDDLSKLAGSKLFFKLELLQHTGSFKPRGVFNKLNDLKDDERKKGVISLSAGNHAQSLAWAATQSKIKSTLIMPATASATKVIATKEYGGSVIQTDGNLLDTCLEIQTKQDLVMVHPFDDPLIIAGQGTIGIEILEDIPDVDIIITGIGGGGLISGICAAVKPINSNVRVVGMEPEGACAMNKSLLQGSPIHLENTDTIADGLAAPFAGQHTLAHVKKFVDQTITVSDDEILAAMKLIFEKCRVTAEPAAAAALAGLLTKQIQLSVNSKVVCVISGGNIDIKRLKNLFSNVPTPNVFE